MIADVQDWLDNPADNGGWILIGDEGPMNGTAKAFGSGGNLSPAARPELTINFTP
jgi:hypothetical protein